MVSFPILVIDNMDLSKYYNNEMLSDCTVDIRLSADPSNIEKLPAHIFMLARSSGIMRTVLEMQNQQQIIKPVVPVQFDTNEEVAAFKHMLCFFYSNNMNHIDDPTPHVMLRVIKMADRFDAPSCFNAALRTPSFWNTDLASDLDLCMEIIDHSRFKNMPRWLDLRFKTTKDLANKLCEFDASHQVWDIIQKLKASACGGTMRLLLIHLGQMRIGAEKIMLSEWASDKKAKAQEVYDKVDKVLDMFHLMCFMPEIKTDVVKLSAFADVMVAARKGKITEDDHAFVIAGVVSWSLYMSVKHEFTSRILNHLLLLQYNKIPFTNKFDNIVSAWRKSMDMEEVERPAAIKRDHV